MALSFLNGLIAVVQAALPSAPTAGIKLVGPLNANVPNLNMVRPGGEIRAVQPSVSGQEVSWWKAVSAATAGTNTGMPLPTAVGTATAAALATTNIHTRKRRLDYLNTTAAVNAVAGFRVVDTPLSVGASIAGYGGFYARYQWGPATGVTNTTIRGFVGLRSVTSAPTDVALSTLTNLIGMGCDSGDTNWQLVYGGATITKVDLGANFPRSTVDRTDWYDVELYAPPGTTQRLDYRITNVVTGNIATGSVSTGLPATTTTLAFGGWLGSGATSSVVGLSLGSLYSEGTGL